MSISFKKILLISIALLFGVMGSSVYAQVTETITFSSGAFAGQSYSVTETFAPFPGASSFNSTNMAWFGNRDLAQALAKAAATDSVLINYANANYGAILCRLCGGTSRRLDGRGKRGKAGTDLEYP